MKGRYKIGLASLALLASFGSGAYADDWMKQLKVNTKPVPIKVDGKVVTPKDGMYVNGKDKYYSTLFYNGVHYVPITKMFEYTGVDWDWDNTIRGYSVTTKAKPLPPGAKTEEMKWYAFETGKISWHVSDRGREYPYLYENSDGLVEQLEAYYGRKLNRKVDAYIYGNESFLGGYRQASYSAGTDTFRINADDLGGGRNQDIRYHFVHELGHAFVHHEWDMPTIQKNLNYRDLWLTEGIAEYAAKQVVRFPKLADSSSLRLKEQFYGIDAYKEQLTRIASERKETISSVKAFADTDKFGEYFFYESIVYFLEKQYGHDKLFGLLDLLGAGEKGETAIPQTFGKDESALVAEWKSYFKLA